MMCGKGTPVRARLSCHCSHVMIAGGALVAGLIVAYVVTHLAVILAVAAIMALVAGLAVYGLVRVSRAVAHHSVMVFQPERVQRPAQPAVPPAKPAAAVSVVATAEEIARAAFLAKAERQPLDRW